MVVLPWERGQIEPGGAPLKKIPWKKLFNPLFLIAVFSLTIWSVFNGVDLNELWKGLHQANLAWLVPGVLCVLVYILSESVIIRYLLHTLQTKVSFRHCCLFSFVGFFYSCITPGAGGGQPMQVLTMRKARIPVAVSSVVLAIITLTFKMVLTLFGLVVMIVRPAAWMVYLEPVQFWIYAGLILNVIWITGLLLLIFWPALVRKLADLLMKLLKKLHLLRNPQRMAGRVERTLSQYQGTSEFFRSHLSVIFKALIITAVQRATMFFVTWLVYKSFSLEGCGVGTVVGLQTMIAVSSDMMPVPGGMGISEALFLEIFGPIFGEGLVLPGMVLSRGISYYTQLFISGVMTAVSSFVFREKKKKGRE